MQEDQAQHADQHQGRTEHRVEEELHRRVLAIAVTPARDQEVHRHEHDLEEHEEHEEIEGDEHPEATSLEDQQPGEVGLGAVFGVDGDDREREQQHGQHDQPQRNAVDAGQPRDAERLDPRLLAGELELIGGPGLELPQGVDTERCGHDRGRDRQDLGVLDANLGYERDQGCADRRQQHHDRDEREADVGGEHDRHHEPPAMRK